MMADAEAVGGRKNFIIIILKDKLTKDELTKELKTYLNTYTYIDATRNTDQVPKRLRYVHYKISFLDMEIFVYVNKNSRGA